MLRPALVTVLVLITLLCAGCVEIPEVAAPTVSSNNAGSNNASSNNLPPACRVEDARAFFRDADGDGFGAAAEVVVGCSAPDGFTAVGGDCADGDAARNPNAAEVCDGVDNSCDGQVDAPGPALLTSCPERADAAAIACQPGGVCLYRCHDGRTDAQGNAETTGLCACDPANAPTWYPDGDGDGYGDNIANALRACLQPPGFSGSTGDCDDADPARHPDAAEVCDALDNNCDGVVNEGADALAQGCPELPNAILLGCNSDQVGLLPGCAYACAAGFADADRDLAAPSGSDGCECPEEQLTPHYPDRDGDGFGDDVWAELCEYGNYYYYIYEDVALFHAIDDYCRDGLRYSCAPLPGYTATGGDCDDANPAHHAGVAEVCDDGADNDCDGYVDNCCDCVNPIDRCANTTCIRPERVCNDLAPCDAGYSCQGRSCVCTDPARCGVVCASEADCPSTYRCDQEVGVCRPEPPCLGDSSCVDGEVCQYGSPLSSSWCCGPQSFQCGAPRVRAAAAIGDACRFDNDCADGRCESGTCLQPCTSNADCSGAVRCITGGSGRLACRATPNPCGACDAPDQACYNLLGQRCLSYRACTTTVDCEMGESCIASNFNFSGQEASLLCATTPNRPPCNAGELFMENGSYCFLPQVCWGNPGCPVGYQCSSNPGFCRR